MRAFTTSLLALLVLAQAVNLQAVALGSESCETHGIQYDCVTQTTTTEHESVAYNFNGTLVNGTLPANSTTNVFDSWPTRVGAWDVPGGLRYGAGTETLVTVPHLTLDGKPFSYTPNASLDNVLGLGFPSARTYTQLIPVARYTLTPTDNQLMSGASDFWLRGAADVNASLYDYHVIEVKDDTGRILIRTSTLETMDAAVVNDRAYYRLSIPFVTGHSYDVTEYVHPLRPDDPVDSVRVWVALLQNPGLGKTEFTAWPGDAVERLVHMTPGYSASFHVGIGQAGIEALLPGNDSLPVQEVTFFASGGVNPNTAPNKATLLVPLRHTRALDVWTLLGVFQNGSILAPRQTAWYHNVTGSFLAEFNVPQGQGGVANTYVLTLAWNLTAGDFATYDMIPPSQAWGAASQLPLGALPYGHFSSYQAGTNDSSLYGFQSGLEHFSAFVPRMEVMNERVSTDQPTLFNLGAPPPLVVDAISVLLFVAHYATPLGFVFDVVEAAAGLPVGPTGDCVLVNGAWSAAGGQGVLCSQAVMQELQTAFDVIFTVVACTAAVVEAGANPVADVACVLGVAATLYDLGFDIVKIVKQALEVVGQVLGTILQWVEVVLVVLVLLIFLALALAGVGLAKLLLVVVLAGIAAALGYDRPTKWVKFRRVYQTYIPLWTEIIERRVLGMEVRA